MKLLICTRSEGKLKEIKRELAGLDFEVLGLEEIDKIPKNFEVEETGKTFGENAILKAKAYGEISGFLSLADDSGLEVDTLDGRPGVFSARYCQGEDKDRNRKLLREMKKVSEEKRGAQFRCVFALFNPETKEVLTAEGIMRGKIAFKPKGLHGFGYDPIFINEFRKTNAEITTGEKNKISHRGKALRKMKKTLKTLT